MYVTGNMVDTTLCFPGLPYIFNSFDETVTNMVSNDDRELNFTG
jgi:hypothetical protein